MFKVIAKIQIWDVPPSNIIVGFLTFDELIMLGNDVNGCRMGSN